MIKDITICNTATFGTSTQKLEEIKKINFFFGSNGTGKTTISRIIYDVSKFVDCSVSWEGNNELEKLVYNRDFIERNFLDSLKGVFTLGEKEKDTKEKIKIIGEEIENINKEIKKLNTTLNGEDDNGGKIKELEEIKNEYIDIFWLLKQKHDNKFARAFEGVRNNRTKFFEKVLNENSTNNADLLTISDLEAKSAIVFSDVPLEEVQYLDKIQYDNLLNLEQSSILGKRIIGKEDVDIAAMIKKLDNSDWMRQGKTYFDVNEGVCPFCQQNVNDNFKKSLNEYFDETFEKDISILKALISEYFNECSRIQQSTKILLELNIKFIDKVKLENEIKLLDTIITSNIQKLNLKKKETSQVIELDSVIDILNKIDLIITNANEQIKENNDIFRNLSNERKSLTEKIWRYIVEELKNSISSYLTKNENVDTAINNIEMNIKAKNELKNNKEITLGELEKQIVSIQPTLHEINKILSTFGFKSFKLDKGNDGKSYKIIRNDGKDAQNTLSEGEKNFVTFLYFYYLLKGSHTESGITKDKIVVFDDPVSSLDNDIMFIVSSLIREIFDDIRNGKGNIKQLFILTHNVYFHKEVAYDGNRRKSECRKDETFWLIKKIDDKSIIEKQTKNPIKTSYQMLWDEVRSKKRNKATIQNTLRRILENYFKLLGNIPLDELYMNFKGERKIICKALCSWIHDGSHSVFDDGYYTILDDNQIKKFLVVFKLIFKKSGQIAHFNMMMGRRNNEVMKNKESNKQEDSEGMLFPIEDVL